MLQLHLSDQQFNCLLRCDLYSRLDGNNSAPNRNKTQHSPNHVFRMYCKEDCMIISNVTNLVITPTMLLFSQLHTTASNWPLWSIVTIKLFYSRRKTGFLSIYFSQRPRENPWCYETHSPLDKMAAILANNIFNCITLNVNDRIPIQISLKYVPRSPMSQILRDASNELLTTQKEFIDSQYDDSYRGSCGKLKVKIRKWYILVDSIAYPYLLLKVWGMGFVTCI